MKCTRWLVLAALILPACAAETTDGRASELCQQREAEGCGGPVGGDFDSSCEGYYATLADLHARMGCADAHERALECRETMGALCGEAPGCESAFVSLRGCREDNPGGESCVLACARDSAAGCAPEGVDALGTCVRYCMVGEVNWEHAGCGDVWRAWHDCRATSATCEASCAEPQAAFESCRASFCDANPGYRGEHVRCE